jgi:hypothetical protein
LYKNNYVCLKNKIKKQKQLKKIKMKPKTKSSKPLIISLACTVAGGASRITNYELLITNCEVRVAGTDGSKTRRGRVPIIIPSATSENYENGQVRRFYVRIKRGALVLIDSEKE